MAYFKGEGKWVPYANQIISYLNNIDFAKESTPEKSRRLYIITEKYILSKFLLSYKEQQTIMDALCEIILDTSETTYKMKLLDFFSNIMDMEKKETIKMFISYILKDFTSGYIPLAEKYNTKMIHLIDSLINLARIKN
jgi:hypothetical protein